MDNKSFYEKPKNDRSEMKSFLQILLLPQCQKVTNTKGKNKGKKAIAYRPKFHDPLAT